MVKSKIKRILSKKTRKIKGDIIVFAWGGDFVGTYTHPFWKWAHWILG